MLKTFEELKKNFKLKPTDVEIDNPVAKLHYRVTCLILLVSCVLITSRQYIGEHIHCINDNGVPQHVMNTFCFFTTTFTVPRHHNLTLVDAGAIPHPGVGTFVDGADEVTHHAYYQWVPFVLFGQAMMFYIPHYIWKRQEGGRLKKLVSGIQYAQFALMDKEIEIDKKKIPSLSKRDHELNQLKNIFVDRLHVNSSWSFWFLFCEALNVVNLILQVYLTNMFLSGAFYSLGPKIVQQGFDEVDILDIVFPKVTKCTFHKYGPSGTIQAHDAMCVMALNIINEKIYTFLWFWYVILGIITIIGLIWRISTILLHSRSHSFNRLIFSTSCPGKLNPWQILYVTKECHFSDWIFLYYLSKNMDGILFRKLFINMAESLDKIASASLKSDDIDEEKHEPLIDMKSDDGNFHEKSV